MCVCVAFFNGFGICDKLNVCVTYFNGFGTCDKLNVCVCVAFFNGFGICDKLNVCVWRSFGTKTLFLFETVRDDITFCLFDHKIQLYGEYTHAKISPPPNLHPHYNGQLLPYKKKVNMHTTFLFSNILYLKWFIIGNNLYTHT